MTYELNAEIVDVPSFFVDATFPAMNKMDWLSDYESQSRSYESEANVSRLIFLTDKAFKKFTTSLLSKWDFLGEGRGGCNSHFELDREVTSYMEMSEEERKSWNEEQYVMADMIINEETKQKILVNQEGYSYARYVGFIVK